MSARSDEGLPVVGICAVRERARWSFWDQPANLVADSYVRAVQAAGGLAVLLPVDARKPTRLVDMLDALLLIGGADVDPATYGAAREPGTEATYPERDEFELATLGRALEREIPVLAICRGMQLLNVAFGGTLVQDLTGPDGTTIHRRRLGGFEGTANHVALDDSSLVARAARATMLEACCHHHQAIDRVGAGLTVSGRALEDGLPEAVEAADGRWILGVQWHPEAEDESAVMAAFVAAARNATRDGASGQGIRVPSIASTTLPKRSGASSRA